MIKRIILSIVILSLGAGIGFFVYKSEANYRHLTPGVNAAGLSRFPFRLGLARIIAGVHFPIDILGGFIIGALVAYFVKGV